MTRKKAVDEHAPCNPGEVKLDDLSIEVPWDHQEEVDHISTRDRHTPPVVVFHYLLNLNQLWQGRGKWYF